MRIVGVDPGLRITGYGVVDERKGHLQLIEAGMIQSSIKMGIAQRLESIHQGVRNLLIDVRPDVMVLEKIFTHMKHITTSLIMGHVRGVICLAAGQERVPLVSLAPTRVRKSILSNGHASKEQVQRAVQNYLHLKEAPKPLDVSDALALAISYAMNRRFYIQRS